MSIPAPLQHLIKELSRLPGFGKRNAQRAALHMLTNPTKIEDIKIALTAVAEQVKTCSVCGNISMSDPCHVCNDTSRETNTICVVEGVDDLWAMERSGAYKGMYHILGGVVSAIDGVRPEDIRIPQLLDRAQKGDIKEVILALGASIDGQTTSHLIARKLATLGENSSITITTLARGIPMGAEVDYMDEGTLHMALKGRVSF